MELMNAYHYRYPGEFQARINLQNAKNNKSSGVWTMLDGTQIRPVNMEGNHLINCIGLTEKRLRDYDIRSIANRVINNTYRRGNNRELNLIAQQLINGETYIQMIIEARSRGLID